MDNTHYIGIIIQTLCTFLRATSEKISGRFSLRKTGRIQTVKKSLAEFAPAGANKVQSIFAGGVYVGKNTSRLANVRA